MVKVKVKLLSRVQLFAASWTVVYEVPPSVEFSKQEYWSGLSCPPPGDLPNPGMELKSPASHVDSLSTEPPGKPYLYHMNPPFLPQTKGTWILALFRRPAQGAFIYMHIAYFFSTLF